MNYNKITIHEFLVIIMTSLDELFSLYCMKQLKMPPDLQELPQYNALARGLSRKQRLRLLDLFDEFSAGFSVYAAECFAQGMRVAFSLSQQLYPLE
nr:hypothetical protein [uncultured Agathobaculum sp.]